MQDKLGNEYKKMYEYLMGNERFRKYFQKDMEVQRIIYAVNLLKEDAQRDTD